MALQQLLQRMDPGALRHLDLLAEPALQRRKIFVDARHHDPIELRARFLDLLKKDVLADDHARAAVLELVAYFVTRIDGTDRRHHRAAFQRGEVTDDELRAVEQIERDALALFEPQARERAGETVGGIAQFPISDGAAIKRHRGALGCARGGLVEGLGYGFEGHLDVRQDARVVVRKPRPRQINLGCALQLACSHGSSSSKILVRWTRSSPRRWPSGRTCRPCTAGSRSTGGGTGASKQNRFQNKRSPHSSPAPFTPPTPASPYFNIVPPA